MPATGVGPRRRRMGASWGCGQGVRPRGAGRRAQRAQPDLGRTRIRTRGPKRRREGPGTPTDCKLGGEA